MTDRTEREAFVVVPRELLSDLWRYGNLRPCDGVIYGKTHRVRLKEADDILCRAMLSASPSPPAGQEPVAYMRTTETGPDEYDTELFFCYPGWQPSENERPLYASPRAPAQEDMTWQPIETAPKDETRVLVAKAGTGYVTTARWVERFSKDHFVDGEHGWFNDATQTRMWNPTHWMPLPKAPEGTP